MGKRLNKFGLEAAEDKTKVIRFTRSRKEEGGSFEFLGFEFLWGVSCKGKDTIKRRTSRKRFRRSLENFTEWCSDNRNFRLKKLFSLLNAKELRGYYNHYGVIGNYDSLEEFYTQAMRILYKWLNRRSQRRSFNYEGFPEVLRRYQIEKLITEKPMRQLLFPWS